MLWITAHGIEMLLELHPEKAEVISHQPPSHGFLIHINVDQKDDTVFFCQPGSNLIVSYHPNAAQGREIIARACRASH